jgi:hypothetical protein
MIFKNSKDKMYFVNNGTLITLKESYKTTYNFVKDMYGEIREKYLDLNKDSVFFGKIVKIYVSDTSFDKIKKELKITKEGNSISFGFGSHQRLFELCNSIQEKQDDSVNKAIGSPKSGYKYTKEI